MLAPAMRLHWFCVYLFMLNGLVYLAGLLLGGEWRSLLRRAGDVRGSLKMAGYYLGTPFAILARRRRVRRRFNTKYDPLQRVAYFAVPVAGFVSVLTGWAIHKPMQLSWLAALFGGFGMARVWHFWLMCTVVLFVVPHLTPTVSRPPAPPPCRRRSCRRPRS
jgi:thiosulfate reductase cytochrome b subunit